jgi:leukotriene-A4 hydrolase
MMHYIITCLLVFTCSFIACDSKKTENQSQQQHLVEEKIEDFHTLSNADSIEFKHLDLNIEVDFTTKSINGVATWTIANYKQAKFAILDNKNLIIDSTWVDDELVTPLIGNNDSILGAALQIPIKNASTKIVIKYATSPTAKALQWLAASQTKGKKHGFLYTQSESIQARSWVPCPDGPGIRFTYSAQVKVPKGMMALMSADGNTQKMNTEGVYKFNMPIRIPAYLLALAVGDLRFKALDSRTGVYAEPEMIEQAAAEFKDVGRMVHVAEKLYGPYQWGRYDMLVLPPGFPIGGMENPKLTFCTPTIIAGDQSLVNLIAHELAHSWSGNYVTNATWDDIWMNEGFTVYFERRISEAMNDSSYAAMLWELGYQDLELAINEFGSQSKETWLKQYLKGKDSDNGLSDIPYEKGALFLRLLEEKFGRKTWDVFLNKYFETHAFSTITTEAFLEFLDQELIQGDTVLKNELQIKNWVYGPGIPNNAPRLYVSRFVIVDSFRNVFLSNNQLFAAATKQWSTHEWLHFLRKMPTPLKESQLQALDNAFHFTKSQNAEIQFQWFMMGIEANYEPIVPHLKPFLEHTGRQKFILPLYKTLLKSPMHQLSKDWYLSFRNNYHPIAQEKLDQLMKY